MKILTAAEMGAADRATTERFGIPLGELMERAGTAVASFLCAQYPRSVGVTILCGTGNNGGDGFVAARALLSSGMHVSVVLLGDESKLRGIAADAFGLLDRTAIHVTSVTDDAEVPGLRRALEASDVVVDAVVGTGFKPPLRGVAVAVRDLLATVKKPVVAVDLPSGWDADSQAITAEGAFRADAVVTFTAPKVAHVLGHLTAPEVFGPVVVAPIGSPADAVESATRLTWTGVSKRLFEKPRIIDSNKGMYGHVLLIGGASGKAGAPSMASLAALRAGAGLVTAAVPRSILNNVALITPELMTTPLDEDASGAVALSNASPERLEKLLKKISVLAIGPGLGTEGEAPEFVRKLVASTNLPLVIDADGLNAFKGQSALLKEASRGGTRTLVLTPHPGEMATLLGVSTKEVQADRVHIARKFAQEHGVTLVLKGWRTLVAHPDGEVSVNTTGNPSMAKGGSGDILTGIVAACVAQEKDNIRDAVNAAVYLHGLAADFAAHRMEQHTVLATDTVAHLSDAFRYRTLDANRAEWICGLRE
ncbi:bifunctional ADP-dependent NAD(P)H-hydrate dehydratase/NAD(P)H-hydrate epimerase [Terriglobus roseus]|uniref:Bifunctional NAD(P)H-hydrate repair enzyme n=1 Tax=Terriglobus roseus TaxID=392734 RepID=A0A1H4RIC9_9BACT|nr:bifunctional ADP-dependent NAD(P)H-hydrate dehydratase/NAD(P)H-hydrate epimerase [Terriglobus roseus]SEC31625.1 NAD(P)H-hydrate epimerase [Terriglobus roseus]